MTDDEIQLLEEALRRCFLDEFPERMNAAFEQIRDTALTFSHQGPDSCRVDVDIDMPAIMRLVLGAVIDHVAATADQEPPVSAEDVQRAALTGRWPRAATHPHLRLVDETYEPATRSV